MTVTSSTLDLSTLIQQQRTFWQTGATKPLAFRLEQLQRLKQAIMDAQEDIVAAVKADLGRPEFESYIEIAAVGEINLAMKQLKHWMKPHPVKTSVDQFPAKAWVQMEPLGVVLILGPWNYPFQLVMSPLVGAIAAGNCAILKPSEQAPHVSNVLAKLIQDTFDPHYIAAIEGDVSVSQALLAERFDHIFFTGGTAVGRIVMAAAAKHLTPVTLELGGKSPCIVDTDIHLDHAARRIIWGKFLNAGQTCIAPDYLLVHEAIKPQFVPLLVDKVKEFFGENPAHSPDLSRIVNRKQFDRLTPLLNDGQILIGGQTNPETRFIAPTLLDQVSWDDPVMQDEIFGPILPILTYTDLQDAIAKINARPKPLALYFFSRDRDKQAQILAQTSSGGVCLNDTVMQAGVWGLPFGGVGESGMGRYHGRSSFETFSSQKSVLRKSFWLDLDWRYAPYTAKQLQTIKRIVTGK